MKKCPIGPIQNYTPDRAGCCAHVRQVEVLAGIAAVTCGRVHLPELKGVVEFAYGCDVIGADPVALAATYILAGQPVPVELDVQELLCVWQVHACLGHRESVPYVQALQALRRGGPSDAD